MAQAQLSPAELAAQAAQANAAARAAVLANAIEATQQIANIQGVNPANTTVINIAPRNVGLIKGFHVHVSVALNVAAGATATRSPFGPANCLSLITFNDLSNQQRINAQGWMFGALDTARRRRPANAAFNSDTPLGFASNYPIMNCPATITGPATPTIDMWYYVPIAYTDRDLRGAIYAAVVNAVMNLQLTLNSGGFFDTTGNAKATSVYGVTGGAATITSWGVEVFQDYLDQLPFSNQGPVLPFQDLSWSYLLNTTFFTNFSVGQDFPIPFPNFRNIQAMFLAFQNGSQMNAGTDINYLALSSANYTNIFKVSPGFMAMQTRNIIGADMPTGSYYFDFRKKPYSTVSYGNLNLIVNPSLVNASAVLLAAFEQLAQQNQVVGAGSIPAG